MQTKTMMKPRVMPAPRPKAPPRLRPPPIKDIEEDGFVMSCVEVA
jgi:hypothetical protein